jgi:signal transduction histidine kinase
MGGRWVRIWIGIAGTVAGLGAEWSSLGTGGRPSDVLLDLAIGLTYLYGGLVTAGRVASMRTGALMAGVGVTWFIRPLVGSEVPAVDYLAQAFQDTWAVLLLALVVSYPSGRFETRFDRIGMLAFAAGVMALPILLLVPMPLVVNEGDKVFVVAFGLAILATALVVRRWVEAPARRREEYLPVLVAGGLYILSVAVNLIRRIFEIPDADAALAVAAVNLAPAAIPVALLIGFYRQSERRMQALVDAIPDPLYRVDREGRLLDTVGARPGGRPKSGPLGAVRHALFPARSRPLSDAIEQALDHDDLRSVDLELELPGGRRELEVRLVPSGPNEVTAIARDFTEQREAEAEVRRSRARIVEAADAERRRVERNLHDGAQQRLVALSLALRRARTQLAEGAHDAASATLEEAATQLTTALAELRELARGIHPAILTEAGLGAALHALATESPIPTTLELDAPAEISPQVEAAVYYVVAETLANVAKYAQASAVQILLGVDQGSLRLEIRDDGRGGADPSAGSGIRGLTDRVAALGGRLDVRSPEGKGTQVVARFPMAGATVPG